jgi:peptidoglycan hydrolase CwlO-like protein
MSSSRTRQATATLFAIAALVTALLTVASSATANPSIDSKRAQAQAVLAEIHETDAKLEHAIEAFNYANVQLEQIDADLTSNARHLVVARNSLGVAQAHVADRLRALYVNGDGGGAVEIILGAESLDDLLNRIDMVERVGDQDAEVLQDVKVFRKEVETA